MGEKKLNSIDCPPMCEEIVVFGNNYVHESRNFFLISSLYSSISMWNITQVYTIMRGDDETNN